MFGNVLKPQWKDYDDGTSEESDNSGTYNGRKTKKSICVFNLKKKQNYILALD